MGDPEKIFGFKSSDCLIKKSILATIQVIYENRQVGNASNLQDVKRKFSYQMQARDYIALTNNTLFQ